MNAREYREHLYQNRSHPERAAVAGQQSDAYSFYFSIVGFVALEGLLQFKFAKYPSGLIFPTGYLVFWAFFFTYYKPGHLENKLSNESKWDLSGIPETLLSSCIWFVKVMFVELIEKLISSVLKGEKAKIKPAASTKNRKSSFSQGDSFRKATYHHKEIKSEPVMLLPRDLNNALHVMGIPHEREWITIQKRYRELAKRHHPDLNPDLTQAGNRFMLYDAAYRKLEAAKHIYFQGKDKSKPR